MVPRTALHTTLASDSSPNIPYLTFDVQASNDNNADKAAHGNAMAAPVVVVAPVVPEVAATMATLLPLTAVGHQRSSAGVLLDDHEDDASLLVSDVKVISEL
ncbi:hypothetical protein TYRP_009595 [Tyrophagus putrescentiae]|nr:hypothetical protein TYRP_009595 [Tyrophagus putrescentiae]